MKGFFGKFAGGTKKSEEEDKPQPTPSTTANNNSGGSAGAIPTTGGSGGMFAGLNTKKKGSVLDSEISQISNQSHQQQPQLRNSQSGSESASFSESFSGPNNQGPKKMNAFGFINKSSPNQEQPTTIQPDPNTNSNFFANMKFKNQNAPPTQNQSLGQLQTQPQTQTQSTMDLLEFADLIQNAEPQKPMMTNQQLGDIFQPIEPQTKSSSFGFVKFAKKENQSHLQTSNILAELEIEKEQNYDYNPKANDSTDLGDRPGFGNINDSFDKQSAISHHLDDQSLNNITDIKLENIDYSANTPTQLNTNNFTVSPKEETINTGASPGMFGKFKVKKQIDPAQDASNFANQKNQMPRLGDKPDLTPEKVILDLRITISNNQEKLGDIIVEQHHIKQSREAKSTQITELKDRLQIISQRQNAAIENDRFEEADELEKATETVRAQIKSLEVEMDECNTHYTMLDKGAQALYQEEYETYRNFIDSLEQALYHRNKELSEYVFEGERAQAKDKEYAEREQHNIENIKKELEFKQRTFEDNKKHIEEQMEKQTKESFEEQGRLSSRKEILAEEIMLIKRELAAKEAEFLNVSTHLDKVNKQIGYVQKRFEADFLKLKIKEEEVNAIDDNYEKKLKALNRFKEGVSNEGEAFQQTVTRNKQIIKDLEKLKDEYKNTMIELNKVNKKREQLLEMFHSSEVEYQKTKVEYRRKEEEVQTLAQEIKMIQGKVNGLMVNKGNLSQKLPLLETEKRNYAQARNFKEASRVTNEKNEIQTQITKIEEEIAYLNSKELANHELIEKNSN